MGEGVQHGSSKRGVELSSIGGVELSSVGPSNSNESEKSIVPILLPLEQAF